ncbi:hypothetical protein [Nonomuraea sp. NPDC049129]|uniref:hypothetical protein n=1 Tax=Nonomuraea sp. NPDC049129 TaxID=3155272 RepID=UPI0033FD1230
MAMEQPGSGLTWLAMRRNHLGNVAALLQQLALGQIPLTHDAFHELQPWRVAAHLEELLVACGVLPAVGAKMAEFESFRILAEQGLRAIGDDPARRRRLELMRDMYAFMMDRCPISQADAPPPARRPGGARRTPGRHGRLPSEVS